MASVIVALHALAGAIFLGALIGRWILLGLAERATTLPEMEHLTSAARPFERIVIVGSVIVLVLGVTAAIAQGRPFLGPLQGSRVDWLFVSVILYVTIIPLVPLVFVPAGKIFDEALGGARSRGAVTPELVAAWRAPRVRAAHVYELGAVTAIFLLMVGKPF